MKVPSSFRTSPAFKLLAIFAFALFAALPPVIAGEVENPPDVAGFRGEVTGIVRSAQPDGSAFVLAVTEAKFDPDASKLKENAPLVGKELTIGVRMPKQDGQAHQHPADLAYIKSLKAGDSIVVKIFSVFSNPRVLRIQEPGRPSGTGSAAAPK